MPSCNQAASVCKPVWKRFNVLRRREMMRCDCVFWVDFNMVQTVFVEVQFWLLVLFSIVVPVLIYVAF